MLKGNILELKDRSIKKPNYPEHRAPYKNRKPSYRWRSRKNQVGGFSVGILALLCMYYFVAARVGIEQAVHSSNYRQWGITEVGIYTYLRRVCPEVFVDYRKRIGSVMGVDLPRGRFYMWYLKHVKKGCNKTITAEHPVCWMREFPKENNEAMRRARKDGLTW